MRWKPSNRQKRAFLEALYDAQHGFCASCGGKMFLQDRHPVIESPMLYASEDHLRARKTGGSDDVTNRVAMHIKCNSRKMHRAPTGCELIFHALVLARLDLEHAHQLLAGKVMPGPAARPVNYGEPPRRATLGDLWPKMGGTSANQA